MKQHYKSFHSPSKNNASSPRLCVLDEGDLKPKTIWKISICRWRGRAIQKKSTGAAISMKRDKVSQECMNTKTLTDNKDQEGGSVGGVGIVEGQVKMAKTFNSGRLQANPSLLNRCLLWLCSASTFFSTNILILTFI